MKPITPIQSLNLLLNQRKLSPAELARQMGLRRQGEIIDWLENAGAMKAYRAKQLMNLATRRQTYYVLENVMEDLWRVLADLPTKREAVAYIKRYKNEGNFVDLYKATGAAPLFEGQGITFPEIERLPGDWEDY